MKTEWTTRLKTITGKLGKFKYPLLILLLGLVLVLLPTGKESREEEKTPAVSEAAEAEAESEQEYCQRIEAELSQILSQIDGAGQVKVMLTLRSGKKTLYQSDYDTATTEKGEESSGTTVHKTVILSRGSAYDEAAVVKTDYPDFQGALIVSQGAADATVRLELVNAVSALLGLGTDKITVAKMK